MHDHEEQSWSSHGLKRNIHRQPIVGTLIGDVHAPRGATPRQPTKGRRSLI